MCDADNYYDEVGKLSSKDEFVLKENHCYKGIEPLARGGITETNSAAIANSNNSCSSKKRYLVLGFVIAALLLVTLAACVAFAVEIYKIDSRVSTLNNVIHQLNASVKAEKENSAALKEALQQLGNSLDIQANISDLHVGDLYDVIEKLNISSEVGDTELEGILHQINNTINAQLIQGYQTLDNRIERLNVSSGQSHSTIGVQTQELNNTIIAMNLSLRTGLDANNPASSCAALSPFLSSGYYWVRASRGSAMRVYCDMSRSCGGIRGWMRMAYLDMANGSHRCPRGLRQRTDSLKRTCRKNYDRASCSSVIFPSMNVRYSKVCGRIIGYQVGSTDAFSSRSINTFYVDGISLTHGNPKQHIWTFAAGNDEGPDIHACPCLADAATSSPAYVGNNYFCETGRSGIVEGTNYPYWGDPLWDGAGCGDRDRCCSFNTPPWFYRQLSPTTDGIEMRVCRDESITNEDIAIQLVELYIQ